MFGGSQPSTNQMDLLVTSSITALHCVLIHMSRSWKYPAQLLTTSYGYYIFGLGRLSTCMSSVMSLFNICCWTMRILLFDYDVRAEVVWHDSGIWKCAVAVSFPHFIELCTKCETATPPTPLSLCTKCRVTMFLFDSSHILVSPHGTFTFEVY